MSYGYVSGRIPSEYHPFILRPSQMAPQRTMAISKEWGKISTHAQSCVGKVLNAPLNGCGILIGIDRLLVPRHVVQGTCTAKLEVQFDTGSHSLFFSVTGMLTDGLHQDFCILQLGKNRGDYPGNLIAPAVLSYETYHGSFLFARFDGDFAGSEVVYRGGPCPTENFCSEVNSSLACSGSGCFDANGRLFALHLKRSTGMCGVSSSERRAIYLNEIFQNPSAQKVLTVARCTPSRPVPLHTYIAPIAFPQGCYSNEGSRPAVNDHIDGVRGRYEYWEQHPMNDIGDGPRGIAIAVPGSRAKVVYKFIENPHIYSAYNTDPEPLYESAAEAYKVKDTEAAAAHYKAKNPREKALKTDEAAKRAFPGLNANHEIFNKNFEFVAYGAAFHAVYDGKYLKGKFIPPRV